MWGCTPYSADEERVRMKSPDELQEYYDYIAEVQSNDYDEER